MRILLATLLLLPHALQGAQGSVAQLASLAELAARVPVPTSPVVDVIGYGKFTFVPGSTSTNLPNRRAVDGSGAWIWEGNRPAKLTLFNAVGDGVTDDTVAIKAWGNSGLNSVEIDSGKSFKYSSRIDITNAPSNFTIDAWGELFAADGANYHQIVIGSQPTIDTNGNFICTATNITINGHGIGRINGNALNAVDYYGDASAGCTGDVAANFGGHLLYIIGWNGVVVDGLTLRDGPNWTLAIEHCQNVYVARNRIYTGNGNNSVECNGKNQDGMGLAGVQRAWVYDNYIESTDDEIGIHSFDCVTRDIEIYNNRLQHKFLPNVNGFRSLGYGVRITKEAGNFYVDNVSVHDNNMYGGNGAITMQNVGTAAAQTRNVRIFNNTFYNKTDLGTFQYPSTYAIIAARVLNVVIENNRFENLARIGVYVQDGNEIAIRNNVFTNMLNTSTNIYTPTAILVDASNAQNPLSGISIEGNKFQALYQHAFRSSGFKSGTGRMVLDPILLVNNRIENGPLKVTSGISSGDSAILISDIGDVHLIGNNVHSWEGHVASVNNYDQLLFQNNVIYDIGEQFSTNSSPIIAVTTNGVLSDRIVFTGNVIWNTSGQVDLRNPRNLTIAHNAFTQLCRRFPSLASVRLSINGDGGGNPADTATIHWAGGNNEYNGTNTFALSVDYLNAPAYAGSPVYFEGDAITGHQVAYSRGDMAFSPDYELFDQRFMVGRVNNSFGKHNFIGLDDSANTNNSPPLFVERRTLGSGISNTVAVLDGQLIINRIAGSGGFSGIGNGLEVVSSFDQPVNSVGANLFGVDIIARNTSSGQLNNSAALRVGVQNIGSGTNMNADGVFVRSPNPSAGRIGTASGITISPQANASVDVAMGLKQLGGTTSNLFAGVTHFVSRLVLGTTNDPAAPSLLITTNTPTEVYAPGSFAINRLAALNGQSNSMMFVRTVVSAGVTNWIPVPFSTVSGGGSGAGQITGMAMLHITNNAAAVPDEFNVDMAASKFFGVLQSAARDDGHGGDDVEPFSYKVTFSSARPSTNYWVNVTCASHESAGDYVAGIRTSYPATPSDMTVNDFVIWTQGAAGTAAGMKDGRIYITVIEEE